MVQYLSKEYCDTNRTKKDKVRCPNCYGNDCYITEHNGRGYCFECTSSYRLGEYKPQHTRDTVALPVEEIREFYQNILMYYQESLQKPQQEYLHRRGLDTDTILKFRVGYCPNTRLPQYHEKIAKEAGLCFGSGDPFLAERIIFPYIAFEQITDLRGRCLGDEVPRYKSPYHQARLRGAIYPFNYDIAMDKARQQKFIILTEGEIKAIIGDMHGFPVVALPGMTNWRAGTIIDSDIRVIVMFDSSARAEDRMRIDKAIANVAEKIPSFSVVQLPLLNQEKMDIDTYLLDNKGGPERFRRLLDDSVDYPFYKKIRKF